MTRRPFEPHGEEARWRTIYRRLVQLDVDETITYEELSELVGFDIREDRSPYQRAAEELLDIDHRALVNERGVGYKVIAPSGHREQARRKTKEAHRRLGTAKAIAEKADRNGLSAEETRRLDEMSLAIAGVLETTRRLARRTDRLEAALKASRRESKEDVAALNERMSRLERLVKPRELEA